MASSPSLEVGCRLRRQLCSYVGWRVVSLTLRKSRVSHSAIRARPGVLFPPHGGGEMEIWRLFPPHISRPWGGNSVYFPPIFRDPGGEIQLFPPKWGGNARRRLKILRIWRSEMLNFLYKNVFQRLKSLKFSACGGLFSCLDSFTKYIVVTETLKKIRLRRATLCVFIIGLSRIQRANRFANSRSAFCAS